MAEAAALDSLKWVVSPLLSRLWNEVFNRLGTSKDEQHKLLQDLETISLPGLSLAIEKAENSPKRHQLENWLERLKDAYYKTEEAIDLFTYYELQQKVHDERKSVKPNIVDRIKTEVSSFASHHHMLTSTKKKITEFLQIIKEFRNYRDLLQDGDAGTHDRETVSALEEKVFGRDRDREIIVSKLTKESITDHGPSIVSGLNILAITGRPGIGKTTLAKYVYNYLSKEGHFDIFMWVYVPRKFRAGDVINKMMKAKQTKEDLLVGQLIEQKDSQFELQSSSHDNYPLEGLSVEIKKMFHSKKCLLVLDDFLCCTGTDREQWKKFMSCLSCWGSESKILITTQSTEAVRQVSVPEENIYKLDQLEEDLFFELFMYHASGNTSNMKDNSLEVVGRKVANKLNGDPKAAEVVGSQLRKKGDIIEWEKVSKKDWSGDEIMKSRIWSYQNLHADLQRCFAFCGLFPKGFRFVGKTLIYLWMAEGFIKSANNGKRIEDIGESYLHELVSSHFLDKRVDEEGKENYVDEEGKENQVTFIKSANYVLHDLLHDLAEQVCGANYLRMEYNNYVEIPRDTRNKLSGKENVHHLSLQASMISELKDDICKQKELRTLIIFDGDGTVSKKDLKEIIQTSEKLRVLSLPSCGIKDLPDSIGSLKHLRYIDISGCS
ncbi:Disease resistance protein (CC-NBS-LRR class) family [Rhynchospora pubera]|uniref:Disease resistance protein (CC-NBS-LRR class) family n=1 Tax=Rhynchospora pubera TaxID=906938 RepID=A0AAV8CEI7_9POAL|nr:Disease resistance protein (CC-NBS-LRR class) family [Rhynchospora pubera]